MMPSAKAVQGFRGKPLQKCWFANVQTASLACQSRGIPACFAWQLLMLEVRNSHGCWNLPPNKHYPMVSRLPATLMPKIGLRLQAGAASHCSSARKIALSPFLIKPVLFTLSWFLGLFTRCTRSLIGAHPIIASPVNGHAEKLQPDETIGRARDQLKGREAPSPAQFSELFSLKAAAGLRLRWLPAQLPLSSHHQTTRRR